MITMGRRLRFADGSSITIRPLEPTDGRLLSTFAEHLSPDSRYRRFFSTSNRLKGQWVARLVGADQEHHLVEVAIAANEAGETMVAVGESVSLPERQGAAEVALVAVDPWQDLGVGTMVAGALAARARRAGVTTWEAHMLADNAAIGRVLARVADRAEYRIDHGVSVATYTL